MKRAIGFLGGQYGDIVTTIAAQKIFKEDFPNYKLTLAASFKFKEILPIFKGQDFVNDIHIWQGYDESWPTDADLRFIKDNEYKIIFNPMQGVGDGLWFNRIHQVSLCCERYGLRLPESNQVSLQKKFLENSDYKNTIFLSVFPNNGQGVKAMSMKNAISLTDILKKEQNKVYQISGPHDPQIPNVDRVIKVSFLEILPIIANCKLLITGDTSICWIASTLEVKTLGLFARGCHPNSINSKNWQPINPNAIYLEADNVNNINLDKIVTEVKNLI